LGPDDAVVKKVLGKDSPRDLAASLVAGSRLKDIAYRKQLLEGGKAAVDASDDAMIRLARLIEPDAREIRRKFDDEIDAVLKQNDELIAKAQFEIYGTATYPDATFSPRLSFGQVKGFEADGAQVSPLTRIAGLFDRETGKDPFILPQRWLAARPRLAPDTPMDFATTNDIIGGNSGSPVVDRQGRVIGLVFDGNIYSLGGEYWFDESVNRTVAVHGSALLEALDKVYGANRILDEIRPAAAPASASGGGD
ncbi:MAG TPA: S46 family peptidase, partial [Patescibacteria group bacterium]|nr:S46 family peptidase [Patescibacteria group bacterium]